MLGLKKPRNTQFILSLFLLFIFIGGFFGGYKINEYFFGKKFIVEEIDPISLAKKLENKNFTFINVHTPYEGEIERTDLFIPYDEIVANRDRLPKDKNAPIVVYCKTGRMSKIASSTIKSLGYKKVVHLKGGMDAWKEAGFDVLDLSKLSDKVLPEEGFLLPISWMDIGPKLVEIGVIDLKKFEKILKLTPEQKEIFEKGKDIPIKIDSGNSQFVVDVLWALGLAQKSKVYEDGPMGKEYKDERGNFASTGGWTLGKEDPLFYLNRFDIIPLTEKQQEKVKEIAKNVYRPCCGNSTFFPDCNHGMAALAAIELMVSAGIPEDEIYKNLLKLNSFWFPDSYLVIATYFERQKKDWALIDAKEVLGDKYSSAKGIQEVFGKVGPLPYPTKKNIGGCGV